MKGAPLLIIGVLLIITGCFKPRAGITDAQVIVMTAGAVLMALGYAAKEE